MKAAARLVAIVGAATIALFLWRSSPRDVVLVYDLGGVSGASSLEVVIRKDGAVVRRVVFPSPDGQVRHAVRLTDGSYQVAYRLVAPSGPVNGERDVTVSEAQTIVLPVAR